MNKLSVHLAASSGIVLMAGIWAHAYDNPESESFIDRVLNRLGERFHETKE